MSSLQISERREGGTVVVVLTGRADLASEADLDRELTRLGAARPALLVFDLSGLELITSLAIGQLVALTQSLRRNGGEVVLAAAGPLVQGVLDRARLGGFIRMVATVPEACAARSQA